VKGVIRKPLAVLVTVALLMLLLTSLGYAAKDTQLMKHWHPMFVEAVLGYFGISFFGHDHTRHSHKVEDGAFVRAPITSCWKYDFLEADCDGPDHYKAFVADGERPDSRIRAYMGDRGDPRTSPVRAKACGMSTEHVYCVSDYSDDGKIVWRETHHNLDKHMLTIGCPGPRKELPCVSRD
jgi:hypothetical protein